MAELTVENVWMETQGRRVDHLLYDLEKYRMSGSYGGELNLNEIIILFKGAKHEINKLQSEIFKLKKKIAYNCQCPDSTDKDEDVVQPAPV